LKTQVGNIEELLPG